MQPETGPAARGQMYWKRWALGVLWIALVVQIWWTVQHLSWPASRLQRPVIFTVAMMMLGITRGRVGWSALVARLVVASAFLMALLDRFGDFADFIRYTGRVNSFLPSAVIPTVAVVATVCEGLLCVTMLLGIGTRWAAAGSAVLLCLFATAMTISGLSQATWAVYVLSAGALVLATTDASLLSVDRAMRQVHANRMTAPVETVSRHSKYL
jgi:uncharacterized membrane protein YphA (DoxX/SURF4 family)